MQQLFTDFLEIKFKPMRNGLKIQLSVIDALIYRELKTRVSNVKFGVFGVFIEPVGVLLIFILIIGGLRRNSNIPMSIALFLLSGITLYTLFSSIAIRALNAINANKALFIYRLVKPVDTVIARAIVETGLYSIVFLVISCAIFIFKAELILANFPLLVIVFISLSFCATGFGLFFMVAGFRYEWLSQVVPLLLRPLWFLSGVFFSIQQLPQWIRPWLSWNPILQAIELTRSALDSDYILNPTIISLPYLISCSIISITLGLWIYLNNEKILLTR